MSDSTRYWTMRWAEGKTQEQIVARIAELHAQPAWQGCEFDDSRVRHKHRCEIETLQQFSVVSRC